MGIVRPPPDLPQMQTNTEFGGGECDVEVNIFIDTPIEMVLSQMPKRTEFGGGKCDVKVNIFIDTQVRMVPPPFLSRCSSRGTNGGG